MSEKRPPGLSSRVKRARGEQVFWDAPGGVRVELPVTVDVVFVDLGDGARDWSAVARVDLLDGLPGLTSVKVERRRGLFPDVLQQQFRWSSPLDVVTLTIPKLLALGIDPFSYHYPTDGFPEAAYLARGAYTRLTDAFLEEVAVRYLVLGRGYAAAIAEEHNVSRRTAISWVEKARKRGILSSPGAGSVGGQVIPRSQRP
jgi:hypothetical protein